MTRRIKGEGPWTATSFWCGLGPGIEEARRGRVWCGQGGQLLDNLLYRNDINRSEIFITNLRSTMIEPGDGGPLAEIEDVEYELARVDPPVVVTMGREATRWLLGDVDMEAVHGIPWRANGRVVVPIYNPAYALHDAESFMLVADDIRQVRRVLNGEVPPRDCRDEYPNPDYGVGFVPYPRHRRVFVDTEGFPNAPYCVTYCCVPGKAHMVLATDKAGLRKVQEMLDQMEGIYLHSAMWDLAVMRAMHLYVRDDQLNDTKVMVYVNGQIDPPGLKPLGFRYANMRMTSYDELTHDYDFVQAYEYLERVAQFDWGKPEPALVRKDGKWTTKQPQGLNTRLKSIFTAVAKGAPDDEEEDDGLSEAKGVDPRKRWFKIEADLRAPAEAKLGPMPDFHLGLVPIKDVTKYACRDADATCRIEGPLWSRVKDGNNVDVYRTDIAAMPMVERMQANGMLVEPGYFPKLEKYFQTEMDKIRKQIESYNGGKFLNPNSPPMMAEFLFNRLRLPVLKTTKGGKSGVRKPSTQDKVLEALRGRHPAVGHICDWREMANLKDKFAKQLPALIGPDGRIRGTIRDTTVVSGRYSMSNFNLMAVPTRTKIGKMIRKGFIAGPGKELGTADFDQIEMRVMAHLGNDEDMIRIYHEGGDIHADTAARMFGIPIEEVLTPEGKLLYRDPAKRIGFGIITGITEMGLYDQYRLAGINKYSIGDCADHIRMYMKARPGVMRVISKCRSDVQRDGYIRDMGGRIRYLPGVYSNNQSVKEEALRQSHSHRISGTAQFIKKRAMARVWAEIQDLPGEVEPLLEVHDEMLLEFVVGRRKWVEQMMLKCMSADSGMFRVPITANFGSGHTWADVKD